MSKETTNASVELRWEKDGDGHPVLTDGKHTFFKCLWTTRFRWSCITSPDDGWGIPAHGAADSLLLAIEHAHRNDQLRKSCYANDEPDKPTRIRIETLKSPTEV